MLHLALPLLLVYNMATITTINGSDNISTSDTVINTNFANLNSDKIETSVLDTDTALAANSDTKIPSQKAVKTYVDTQGGANASTTSRGIVEEATQAEINSDSAAGGTGARLFVNPSTLLGSKYIKFGGDGSDGALSIGSGTTTIDIAGALSITKNYTSISITGTGKLAFSNPHASGSIIVLKSQGAVTITSTNNPAIDVSSLGATGGAGSVSSGTAGTTGTQGVSNIILRTNGGVGGGDGSISAGGTGGAVVGLYTTSLIKAVPLFAGAGGGGAGLGTAGQYSNGGGGGGSGETAGTDFTAGANNNGAGAAGAGGRGGGALYIECGGAYNCTGIITAAGGAGTAGSATNGSGGGGGAGGTIIVLYTSLTADTGTYTVSGGAGGAASGGGHAGGAGAAGKAIRATNTEFS